MRYTRLVAARVSAIVAVVIVASASGCPEPTHNEAGPTFLPGVAERNLALLDHLHGDGGGNGAARARVTTPARAHVLKVGEELGGANATGRPGDLVLENDEVAFIIDQLGAGAGFAESGGNLIDAADARARSDELGQVFTYFGAFPRQAVYDELASGMEKDGTAWVEARGHELLEAKLLVTTRYTLAAPDRALLVRTVLVNASDHAIDKLRLGDAIQWGGAEKIAPGKSLGFRGKSSGPYVGGIGRTTSYAITSVDGQIDAESGASWTDTMQTPEATLAPGERVEYSRVFVVGVRGDTASIVAELLHATGQPLGAIEINLVDEAGQSVKTPRGAKVVLSDANANANAHDDLFSLRATREGDALGGEVPPGKYRVTFAWGGGRAQRGAAALVEVGASRMARATLIVSGAGRMIAACVENGSACPCKATFEGLAGAANPDFGPSHVSGPAKNQVTTQTGAIDVPLAPGKYRVTLSRGPEYALVAQEIDVLPGKVSTPAAVLTRVVDTKGYVATDFHQHTMLGADAPVGTRDRVIANAAEGVEIAVASEHNLIADLMPIVRELGLERWLVEISGDELTTDNNRKPWGHANVFPLVALAAKPRGGAFPVRDRSARETFDLVRKSVTTPFVLQVNHPRFGTMGYFNQYAFDPKSGTSSDPGYDAAFDALEVWNGRNVDGRARVLEDFFALLRSSRPVTPTADTDTHGIIGQEAGYPRTMVRVGDDEHLAAWDDQRSADLVDAVKTRRDVVLTNGPFLRVGAGGAPIGGIVKASSLGARDLVVRVHVECAPWVLVDEVRLVRIASPKTATRAKDDVRSVTMAALPSGAVGADVEFRVRVTTDEALVVIARGSKPMTPVLSGDAAEISPWAMTGAVWVDADGDGRSLGR
jgi:hypothetical protein